MIGFLTFYTTDGHALPKKYEILKDKLLRFKKASRFMM